MWRVEDVDTVDLREVIIQIAWVDVVMTTVAPTSPVRRSGGTVSHRVGCWGLACSNTFDLSFSLSLGFAICVACIVLFTSFDSLANRSVLAARDDENLACMGCGT